MSIEYRPCGADDTEAVLALYRRVFGRDYALGEWRWRFDDNPFGSSVLWLALDGDRPVGHLALSPMPLRRGAERLVAFVALNGMVDPAYHRQGVFAELERRSTAAIPSGTPLFGFPNASSFPLFVQRFGWSSPGVPKVYVRPLRVSGMARERRWLLLVSPLLKLWNTAFAQRTGTLTRLSPLDTESDHEDAPPKRFHLARDLDALAWRYDLSPHRYKSFLWSSQDEPATSLVVRRTSQFGLEIAWIMDLLPDASATTAAALRALCRQLDGECDLVASLLPHRSARSALRRAGFIGAPRGLLPHRFFLITKRNGYPDPDFDRLDAWHLSWALHDAL